MLTESNWLTFIRTPTLIVIILHIGHLQLRGDEPPSLRLIQDSNRNAISLLNTIQCRFRVYEDSAEKGLELAEKDEYWRSRDRFCLHLNRNLHDYSQNLRLTFADFKATTFVQENVRGRKRTYGTIIARSDLALDDAWMKALFLFYGPGPRWYTFDDLMTKLRVSPKVDLRAFNGNPSPHLKVRQDVIEQDFWFDPGTNYLVKALVTRDVPMSGQKASPKSFESSVLSFSEIMPGVFFPQRIESAEVTPNGRRVLKMVEFSDVRINHNIPEETFKIRFPPGIEVTDDLQAKILKSQPDGSLKEIPGMAPTKTPPVPTAGATFAQSIQEETSPSRWIMPASLVFVLIGLCGLALRKKKGMIT